MMDDYPDSDEGSSSKSDSIYTHVPFDLQYINSYPRKYKLKYERKESFCKKIIEWDNEEVDGIVNVNFYLFIKVDSQLIVGSSGSFRWYENENTYDSLMIIFGNKDTKNIFPFLFSLNAEYPTFRQPGIGRYTKKTL